MFVNSFSFIRRVTVLSLLLLCIRSATHAEDWPRWRGPRGDGTWQAPDLPPKWPDKGLPVRWKQPLGGGYGGISVVGQRLYVMDRPGLPQQQERVQCLDTRTGDTIWSHSYEADYGDMAYGNGPRATPTVYDECVYTFGVRGHVYCFQARTGAVLWSHDLLAEDSATIPEWGLSASPVIYNDLVILHPGATGGCYIALDRKSGEERWRSGDDPPGYCTPILIEHKNYEQLICWSPRHIMGLNPADGEIQWSIPYEVTYDVSIATPIFHQGIVFVTGYWKGSKAIKLGDEPQDAELLWEENRWLRGLMSQPLCRDGHVYSLDKHHGLVCFPLKDGKKLWTDKNRMTPRGRNPQANLIWLGDSDRAIVLNSDGELILTRLTPEGYQEQSRTKIIGETWAHPALAGKFVYARSDTGIVCVQLVE